MHPGWTTAPFRSTPPSPERSARSSAASCSWPAAGCPERVSLADTVRIGLASYKIGRLIAKDPVTSFVRAPVTEDPDATEPKREGPARALGELLTCPYCIGLWVASGFAYTLVLFPRQTRLVTAIFGGQAVADFLNAAFVRVRDGSS
jgi:hypothetical protein